MLKIGIIAGEPSGDLLGGQLIAQIQKLVPNCLIEGVAGPKLIEQGCIRLFSIDELSVMGFWEPLKKLPQILRLRKNIIKYFIQHPPDIFIGIDSPDFNLGIEKVLHKAGITTVHFVSPSVWAWRQSRVHFIKKYVNLMLALFPFEEKFYKQHNVPVVCTGHPQADEIPLEVDQIAARTQLKIAPEAKLIAILPGSRDLELERMGKTYLQAMQLIALAKPSAQFIMPLVKLEHKEYILNLKAKYCPNVPLLIVVGNSRLVMQACDYALVTSGTATLELMLNKRPMIVVYKAFWLTYLIMKRLIKVKYLALPNLLAEKMIVPELIQQQASAKNLAANFLELINSPEAMQNQKNEFIKIHQSLKLNAAQKAANAILNLIKPNVII
jgi:lipid-A-disaccharide synthase